MLENFNLSKILHLSNITWQIEKKNPHRFSSNCPSYCVYHTSTTKMYNYSRSNIYMVSTKKFPIPSRPCICQVCENEKPKHSNL